MSNKMLNKLEINISIAFFVLVGEYGKKYMQPSEPTKTIYKSSFSHLFLITLYTFLTPGKSSTLILLLLIHLLLIIPLLIHLLLDPLTPGPLYSSHLHSPNLYPFNSKFH